MSTDTLRASPYDEIIARLPPASTLILQAVPLSDYQNLLDAISEARGLLARIG
jgi:hypothetical protein